MIGFRDLSLADAPAAGEPDRGAGSGMGRMDFSVLVRDERSGRAEVEAVVRELAPAAAFTIERLPDADEDG
jgi:hypothetical protein